MNIKRALPEDCQMIRDLVIECCGELASDQHLYKPEELAKDVSEERVKIYVAEEQDRLVSMEVCGERTEFPETLYMKGKMTLPEFRNQGIAKMVLQKMLSDNDKDDWKSFYAYVKNDKLTIQNILSEKGFTCTGFIYNDFRDQEEKHSNMVMVQNTGVKDVGKLYLSSALIPAATIIYNNLNVSFSIESGRNEFMENATDMIITEDKVHCNINIIVNSPGKDMKQKIEMLQDEYAGIVLQSFQLYLNIKSEDAMAAYEQLMEMGYVFSGIKPLGNGAEYIILYNSIQLPVNAEKILVKDKWLLLKNLFVEFLADRNK